MPSLYIDADGQLVIADSMPPGGSSVPPPASTSLTDTVPWFRDLDAIDPDPWHPLLYYSGPAESGGGGGGGGPVMGLSITINTCP